MRTLTVLYDGGCGLCRTAKRALESEPAYVPIVFVEARSPVAAARFPGLVKPGEPLELLAIDDDGGVYDDEDAYLVVLWALKRYRELSYRLATPLLKPLTRRFFALLADNRAALSWILRLGNDHELAEAIEFEPVDGVAGTRCPLPRP